MLASERLAKIRELLQAHGKVQIAQLKLLLNVSEMTLRRDLDALEAEGILVRVYGGAILRDEPEDLEGPSYKARQVQNLAEKEAIARVASGLVREGETILLDAGTTTEALARALRHRRNLTVVTNALNIAQEFLANPNITVILLGGALRHSTQSTVGFFGVEELGRLTVDKTFLATAGITLEQGLTNTNLFEAEIKQAMIRSARQVILLADHSKFGAVSLARFSNLDVISMIITDDGTPGEFIEALRQRGIAIQIAPVIRREPNAG